MKKQVGALALASMLWSVPAIAQTETTWTLDPEFDTGILDSVNHDAPNNHQLQLNAFSSTEPYIWIANFEMGTVTKIDTRSGKQVARYDSALVRNWDGTIPAVRPPRGACNSPSRTAVDGNGNAYVVNRAICSGDSASATKYAGTLSSCVDRNGNGAIDTSSDVNGNGLIDLASSAEYKGQADECILWTKNFTGINDLGRAAAVDQDQNLWVGAYDSSKLFKLDGNTGAVLKMINPRAQAGVGMTYIYGIAIGPGGFIYTSDITGQRLMKVNPNAAPGAEVVRVLISPVPTYGIAVDKNGVAWLGNWSPNAVSLVKADFNTGTVTTHGGYLGGCSGYTRGVALDSTGNIWTSCWSTDKLLKFNGAGTFLASYPVGDGPVGAAVDGDGKIWTVNQNGDSATRFDPATNATASFPTSGRPYSYSDMTGFQQRNYTLRQGDWTIVKDSGHADAVWTKVSWNREPQGSVPAGTTITTEVRAANTLAGLAGTPWVPAVNGAPLTGITGRYSEVRSTLRINSGDISPVLSDVSIAFTLPETCIPVRLSDFNLFLLEDYTGGSDVQGKVAAGRNISMTDFSVGWSLPASDTSNVLVAGNNLSLLRGGVWGDTWYGSAYSGDETVVIHRGTGPTQGSPIDFSARFASLRGLSATLAGLTANGSATREDWGGIMLEGTDPDVNVFNVNASDFTGATLLSITAPAGSLAVINVSGGSATFTGFGHTFNGGIDQHGVLFNFVDATAINANGYGFYGTVLAPYAHVTFNNGSWDGGIYAVSLTGNAEGHINPLTDREICE
jgi:choice-of-anchor A domain-containing protein